MGIVFGSIWSRFFGPTKVKICMVGLDNAGKTTLLFRMQLGETVSTQPTIGSNLEVVSHKNVEMQIWDIGGQPGFRSLWATYFTNSSAIILVVDSTDVKRMPIVAQELQKILRMEVVAGAPLLIIANKQDLNTAVSPGNLAQSLGLTTINDRPWHIQGTSAYSGEGVPEALTWLADTTQGPSK